MNFKKIENLSAILMVVSFFMPWLSLGMLGSVTGFNVASMGGAETLLFVIPLLAIVVLANDVLNFLDVDKSKYLAYLTAVVPLIYIIYRLIKAGSGFFELASIGIYLTLIASVLMILGASGKIKLPE
tara:strand:- start:1104 stop:1484 length:381 start_codon:yes stop_codon:yes gene_type:complete